MRVALLTTFAASNKEPLAEMTGRIRQAFLDAGLGNHRCARRRAVQNVDLVIKHGVRYK